VLDEIMGGGLVTLERAKVIRYQHQEKKVTYRPAIALNLSLTANGGDKT
jgi:hypothetical protein